MLCVSGITEQYENMQLQGKQFTHLRC